MKKVLSLTLSVTLLITAFFVNTFTASAAISGFYRYTVSGNEATIVKCDSSIAGNVTVPSLLGGYSVTAIKSLAFSGCDKITGLNIPESITLIEEKAFYGCSGIESMQLTLQYPLGYYFGGFDISEVQYSSNVNNSAPKDLKTLVVSGKSKLVSYALANCTKLNNVTLLDGIEFIGDSAFSGCSNLEKITIPGSVTTIVEIKTFYGCSKLSEIIIPDSGVPGITSSTFENTEYYNNSNNWINGALYIGENLIATKDINGTHNILDGTKTIAKYAFNGCKVTNIIIPDSVTHIYSNPFINCTELTKIEVDDKNSVYQSINNCVINKHAKELVVGCKSSVIPDDGSVEIIGDHAFHGCSISNIIIPNSTKVIKEYAFCSSGITNINIPDSVTTVSDFAFRFCKNLKTVIIGNKVSEIGNNAFSDCSKLEKINIPGNIKKIGDEAFYDCDSLTTLIISEGVLEIGDMAFCRCRNLINITLPDSLTIIGADAFKFTEFYEDSSNWEKGYILLNAYLYIGNHLIKAKGESEGTVKNGTKTIADYAFSECSELEKITIPDSVANIGKHAFYNCNNLKSIHITDLSAWCRINFSDKFSNPMYYGDLYIDFYYNGSLFISSSPATDIIIPSNITKINDYTFWGCNSLKTVTIPESITEIGYAALNLCDNITDIYYDGTEKNWHNIIIKDYNLPLQNTNIHYGKAEIITGDLNNDDKINSLDGLILLRYLNGWDIEIASPESMDINGDEKINSLDGLMLLRYLNGWNIELN